MPEDTEKISGGLGQGRETSSKEKEPKEIERKFLVGTLPEDLKQYPHEEILQGYMAITEEGVVRLRKEGDKYFQAVKSGSGKVRGEWSVEITKEQFDSLWQTTEGKRLEKTRYKIPHGDKTIELDVYHGDLEGFLSVEVEFGSEKSSEEFTPPKWFGKEVTDDKRYLNYNLTLRGIPEEVTPRPKEVKEKLEIPEYKSKEGIEKLVDLIKEKQSQHQRPVIVEVAGGSASGKTSKVAAKVKEVFGDDVLIFSLDDYYKGIRFMEAEAKKGNILNWDQPEALDLGLSRKHLEQLKEGKPIQKPIYNIKTAESLDTKEIQPKKIIIVEGLFALDDSLKDQGDIKAFVDIGTHGRIIRRLLRDIERTGQKPRDILKYFSEVVEPMHEKYVESTKKNADMIINNEYSPEVEAQRSGLHEVQLKFKAEISQEILRKLGAERLASTVQLDNYYNPRDRNLMKTGEILRIRKEGNKRILTYKGPKVKSKFRKRPKFEFEIDKVTGKKFLSIYGDRVKTIKKDRTLYQLEGIVFSADSVSKREGGKTTKLGNFIEVRSTDKEASGERIEKVISKLGLETKDGIKKSYFEM